MTPKSSLITWMGHLQNRIYIRKQKMKSYLLLFILVGISLPVCGQGFPQWVQQLPTGTSTYYYRVSTGIGLTEEIASKQAWAVAIMESAFAMGIPIDIHKLESMRGDSLLVEASHFVRIPINKVCSYVEPLVTRRGVKVYILCQVARDATTKPQFKSFNCITNREE